MKPTMLISGEAEDGGVSPEFMLALKAVMKSEGVKADVTVHDGQTSILTLCFGKPKDFLTEQGVPMISGPSEAVVMGTPKGQEALRRAILLWKMTEDGTLTEARYLYQLVVPSDSPDAGELGTFRGSGLGNIVQCTPGHTKLSVDIEVSGDVEVDEPEDTELISVGVHWKKADKTYFILVWTKEALADPECRDALVAILTCGVPLVAHNAQFDFKWINNHFERELHTPSKRRRRWGDVFARTPGKVYPTQDTQLKHYALYPAHAGKGADQKLKPLCHMLLGAPEWEKEIKKYVGAGHGHYERIPPVLLHWYNAGDVYWTDLLDEKLDEWLELSPAAKHLYYETLMPLARMFIDIEATDAGWPLNEELAREHEKYLLARASKQMKKFLKMVGDPTPYLSEANAKQRAAWIAAAKLDDERFEAWVADPRGMPAPLPKARPLNRNHQFNPGSPKQVKEWLWAHGCQVSSTDAETQEALLEEIDDRLKALDNARMDKAQKVFQKNQLEEVRTFLSLLEDYRHTIKMCSTNVTRVLQHARGGRSRSRHRVPATITGRLAGAMTHTVPRIGRDGLENREYREMYTADPGYMIIGCDFAQVETRIVAELTGDAQMIDDLQEGRSDFFDLLLPGAFPDVFKNIEEVQAMRKSDKGFHAQLRQSIKPISHGANYMRQAAAMADQLKLPLDQAYQMFNSYMARYPKLRVWQEETMDYVEGLKLDPIWKVPGLYTPFGRRFQAGVLTPRNRHVIHRSAVSFKPQSIGSDLTLSAALDLHNGGALKALDGRLVGFIHDALYATGPQENAEAIRDLMKERMRASGARVFKRVPFLVDGKIGTDWADVDSPKKDIVYPTRKKAKAA